MFEQFPTAAAMEATTDGGHLDKFGGLDEFEVADDLEPDLFACNDDLLLGRAGTRDWMSAEHLQELNESIDSEGFGGVQVPPPLQA